MAEPDSPTYRYTAALAADIESRWQLRWDAEGTFDAPNPTGPLAGDVGGRERLYVLDMFPYPSGSGLHVGHPLGYIGTDVYTRFKRMSGYNVLYTMGFDAFGLPAEQYAVQTGTHPRTTTEANVANMRRQLGRLGLGHDKRRSVSTTDVEFYKWTQWIFLQIYNSWYDAEAATARPISELEEAFASGARPTPNGRTWSALDADEQRALIDAQRLAYVSEAPVNWCPGLGTVVANEEVTADGRSDRGNFPVFKRNMRQWMMRITAYADRLVDDLDTVDWPEPVKLMQRNWIGRSEGARVRFDSHAGPIEVFTTRPDTLFGATFMVLAPEHPLVDALTTSQWPKATRNPWTGGHATPVDAVREYRRMANAKSDIDRQAESREKTGVFTGSFATNPTTGAPIPVFIADYVLMGYGTGAIMAVPSGDQRDFEFARLFELPIIATQRPSDAWFAEHGIEPSIDCDTWPEAYVGEGTYVNSSNSSLDLNGDRTMADAKHHINAWLEAGGHGHGTVNTKLRDWLFSRQRYWGEPFPIVYDEAGVAHALPSSLLPVLLPEVEDYSPTTFDPDDANSNPVAPLDKAQDWVWVELDLGDGPKRYRRDTNVMPQWAGSCWYELRYLDPTNDEAFIDPEVEKYWMGPKVAGGSGGADLYVGGVEHAVLHLLYSRFWHKVLFDLGYVSSSEPFHRLFNQGYILAAAFKDERGIYVDATAVEERDGQYFYEGEPVTREWGKMGKSLKNAVSPDEMYDLYGADTLRLYEMSMGPMDASRPWETKAVVGAQRLLQRIWRRIVDETTGESNVVDTEPLADTAKLLARTIDAVRTELDAMRFNTAIAKLTELNNHLTGLDVMPRSVAESLVLMLAPLAPHVSEELWAKLGHGASLAHEPFPVADPALLVDDEITVPVSINGKPRSTITVPSDADAAALEAAALADAKVIAFLDGRAPKKVIVVPGRMVNVVA
ncbi:MAG: leucine--tRNA ligase [Acidimicrobiia bacterium]